MSDERARPAPSTDPAPDLAAPLTDDEREALARSVAATINYHSFDAAAETADFDMADAIMDTDHAATSPGLASTVERILARRMSAVAALLDDTDRTFIAKKPGAKYGRTRVVRVTAVRAVLGDPTAALAAHDEQVRERVAAAIEAAERETGKSEHDGTMQGAYSQGLRDAARITRDPRSDR